MRIVKNEFSQENVLGERKDKVAIFLNFVDIK
jgi:hypothetical protein